MRFNLKRALSVFLLLELVILMTGCTSTIEQVSALLPEIGSLVAAIAAFVAGLGGTLSADSQALLNKVETETQAGLSEAEALVQSWTQSTSTTVLGKVNDILTAIMNTLSGFTSSLGLSGTAAQKVAELVGLAVTTIEGVLNLLPLFGKASSASKAQLEHADKLGASQAKALGQTLQERYALIVSSTTGDPAVDAALAKLPKTL